MRKRREGKKWNETEIKCKDKKWGVKQKVGKRQNSRIENKETWKSKTKKKQLLYEGNEEKIKVIKDAKRKWNESKIKEVKDIKYMEEKNKTKKWEKS